MVLIFYFSGQTSSELRSVFPFVNDLNPGHIAAYYILTILTFFSLHKSNIKSPLIAALALSVTYGITDEIHQAFVPTRQPDFADLIRDTIGALMAVLTIYLFKKKSPKDNRCRSTPQSGEVQKKKDSLNN
jgi:VanZ family protein